MKLTTKSIIDFVFCLQANQKNDTGPSLKTSVNSKFFHEGGRFLAELIHCSRDCFGPAGKVLLLRLFSGRHIARFRSVDFGRDSL